MNKFLIASYVILVSGMVNASPEETCPIAASKINSIIEDWNTFVIEYSTPEKNPSVISMYKEHEAGTLESNFTKKCTAKWEKNKDVFECFTGIRSEMGAAMCLHPDTNKNNWEY